MELPVKHNNEDFKIPLSLPFPKGETRTSHFLKGGLRGISSVSRNLQYEVSVLVPVVVVN